MQYCSIWKIYFKMSQCQWKKLTSHSFLRFVQPEILTNIFGAFINAHPVVHQLGHSYAHLLATNIVIIPVNVNKRINAENTKCYTSEKVPSPWGCSLKTYSNGREESAGWRKMQTLTFGSTERKKNYFCHLPVHPQDLHTLPVHQDQAKRRDQVIQNKKWNQLWRLKKHFFTFYLSL